MLHMEGQFVFLVINPRRKTLADLGQWQRFNSPPVDLPDHTARAAVKAYSCFVFLRWPKVQTKFD